MEAANSQFYKYHALGNDYLVLDAADGWRAPSDETVRRICDRNYGIGSDGILFNLPKNERGEFVLRIYNPDGSCAEKSGNGLRIYSRYLWDRGEVRDAPFEVRTDGGLVSCQVLAGGSSVVVEMGKVSFQANDIPVVGFPGEVLEKTLELSGETLMFSAASIGNPHCVLIREHVSAEEAKRLGPSIENHEHFPARTNVQFVELLDRGRIRIEIWERGAGYTLASGSSSSAAAAVCHRLGHCDGAITVEMPGGSLSIEVAKDYAIRMSGAVTAVCKGELSPELLQWRRAG